MKTETQIAEENIEFIKECKEENNTLQAETHKASCERFLDFLEEGCGKEWDDSAVGFTWVCKKPDKKGFRAYCKRCNKRITDLKRAIKLYNEAGI